MATTVCGVFRISHAATRFYAWNVPGGSYRVAYMAETHPSIHPSRQTKGASTPAPPKLPSTSPRYCKPRGRPNISPPGRRWISSFTCNTCGGLAGRSLLQTPGTCYYQPPLRWRWIKAYNTSTRYGFITPARALDIYSGA